MTKTMTKTTVHCFLAAVAVAISTAGILALTACAPAATTPVSTAAAPVAVPTLASTVPPAAKPTPAASPLAKPVATPGAAAQAATKPSGLPPLSPRVKVRVGTQNLNQEGPRIYAMERGYFAAEGIEVEEVPIAQATELLQAVATNQIDVAVTGWTAIALNMAQRNLGLKVIHSSQVFLPGKRQVVFVVRKDLYDSGQVRAFKDLKGHSIGVAVPGSLAHFWLLEQLKLANLSENDIDRKTLSFPDQLAAFANKGLDAGIMVEPSGTLAEKQGSVVFVRNVAQDYPNTSSGGGWASPNFMKNEELVRRWVYAWWRGAIDWNRIWLPDRPDPALVQEAVDLGKKHGININPDASYILPRDGLPHPETVRDLAKFFREFAKIEGDAAFDQMVDDRFIKEAVAKLGAAE